MPFQPCRLVFGGVILFAALAASVQLGLAAPPRAEQLVPQSAKAFVVVPDVAALRAGWDKSQFGQLMADPKLQPFVDDLRGQLNTRLSRATKRLGLTWTDLEGIASGSVAFGILRPATDQVGRVLLIDTHGRKDEVDKLLAKVVANLAQQGAKRSQREIARTNVTVYEIPKEAGDRKVRLAFYAVKDEMLLVSDDAAVMGGVLGRWDGKAPDALGQTRAYRAVMARAAEKAGSLAPHFSWFVEPFGFAEIVRIENPEKRPKKGEDMLAMLRNQGFDAIQGIGGYVNFGVAPFELIHRTAVYAPPAKEAAKGEKYVRGARVLDFPNVLDPKKGISHEPPDWVPRDITTYLSFNLHTTKCFWAAGDIVDEIAGAKGTFADVLESIKNDPDGPKVDIPMELVENLDDHAMVVTDYQLPITLQSERVLVAVKAKNPKPLADALDRLFAADANAKAMTFRGYKIWVITAPREDEDVLKPASVSVPDLESIPIGEDDPEEKERFALPDSAITVAYGHLLRASHVEFLKKVLDFGQTQKSLADSLDYQIAVAHMEKLAAGDNSFRFFTRTDEEFRPTYELIKAGKMPLAETMFGRLLNRLFDENRKDEIPRRQRIDGRKLPDYDMVRRYLGPGGAFVTTLDDGWLITGFSLSKQQPPIEVGMNPTK